MTSVAVPNPELFSYSAGEWQDIRCVIIDALGAPRWTRAAYVRTSRSP
jgi:hypothetical protein